MEKKLTKATIEKPKIEIAQHPTQATFQLISEEQYSGPLPHPHFLEHFERITPGTAERILRMVETQAAHRQELEKTLLVSEIQARRLGLIFGFLIGFSGMIGSTLSILYGMQTGGTVLGSACLASLVGIFVYGSKQKQAEKDSKKSNALANRNKTK